MIETVFASELPVGERLLIRKHRIEGTADAPFGGEAAKCGHRPRIAVVTGIHGDELEGQYVAFKLSQILVENLDKLYGTVDIYPAINPLGINSIERSVPMFDVDLNRTFPGKADGDLTETLARAVFDDVSGADVTIDIHASNIFLREMPQVRINEISADELLPLAPLLNVDYVWVHASATVLQSTFAYALNTTGTRTLVVETGVGMRVTNAYGESLTQGILRLAAHLGAWGGDFVSAEPPIISNDGEVSYLNAGAGGIFLPEAEHGTMVKEGQLIGIVANALTGEVAERVVAPASGLLFTLREYPVVYPGSLLGRILKDVK
ncbi:M14 family metallopeptidase [Paratractidigestivibacter sp.]|uniref:M14 family metallopeptidase n=1 Tax=Paratractidigestivibacter sp. TaxID=2847316 RepID=UPI002ACB06AF|nr:M14 family metallopeptidase [Paratractidigestivibacter sp.]